ncbi:cation-transporting ATPase [Clavibacter zhangzhiyongii]|uniref:Cation-transporting ATPase n=1 Tax=Clavibacter zhangzhiyongii TaxID=2768071 RepID=A0A7L7YYT2_9MICO|nr:cation-transporting ATPase [Clavibacter zhangzhiyongii]QOD42640.1 cation-transporting ATPase [Clavibacter zhangzhiyongii]
MPNFRRLLGAAARALGDHSSSSHDRQQPSRGGDTEWRSVVRSAADRLTGDERTQRDQVRGADPGQGDGQRGSGHPEQQQYGRRQAGQLTEADRIALGKYDYLLRTADPEQLEQVHQDAFERLTPAQRELVLARLTEELPAHERPRSGSAADLARAATRGQTSRPGLMQRVLGGHRTSNRGSRNGAAMFAGGAAAGVGVAAIGGVAVAVASGAALSAAAGPLLSGAMADGIDFADLTEGFGLDGLPDLGGLSEGMGGIAQGGEEYLTGIGDQVGGLGEHFQIPGLGDFFDR